MRKAGDIDIGVSDKKVAMVRDGVHDVTRNAAIAKFLFEVFANSFGGKVEASKSSHRGVTLFSPPVSGASQGVAGRVDAAIADGESKHGANMPLASEPVASVINIAEGVIEDLFAEFKKLPQYSSGDSESCDQFDRFWRQKFKESINLALDSGVFYSKISDKKYQVIMPIEDVVAAVATLVLDNDNLYFREPRDRCIRITKLFNNMYSVVFGNICHTGQRDAVMNVLDSVEFYCGDVKRSYRFPETIAAYMSSLQHKYIEQYLSLKKKEDFGHYNQLMLVWSKEGLPDNEIKHMVAYCVKCSDLINEDLMLVGLCPNDEQIMALKDQYFRDCLAYLEPILGEDIYWHCAQEIMHRSAGDDERRNAYLTQLKAAVMAAKEVDETVSLTCQLKCFLAIESVHRNIRRYRLILQGHMGDQASKIITAADDVVAEYYSLGSPPIALDDRAISSLALLSQAVSDFKSGPWVCAIENYFAICFGNGWNDVDINQLKMLDSDFFTDMRLDEAWLDHYFPASSGGADIEFSVYTANYFILYMLTHSSKEWPSRASEVLLELMEYFDRRLGVDEESEVERQQHLAFKNCYPQGLRFMLKILGWVVSGKSPVEQKYILYALDVSVKFNFSAGIELLLPLLEDIRLYNYIRGRHVFVDGAGSPPVPIFITIESGYVKATQALLRIRPEQLEFRCEPGGKDVLQLAVESRAANMVAVILAFEDVQVSFKTIQTAIVRNHEKSLDILKKGYEQRSVSAHDIYQLANIALMCKRGNILAFLLAQQKGACHSSKGRFNFYPKLYSIAELNAVELIETILPYTAIYNDPVLDQKAFILAIVQGNTEMVRVLMAHADIHRQKLIGSSNYSGSMLHVAIICRRLDIVNMLLADEALDLNYRGRDGRTPLHLAALCNEFSVVRVLLADSRVDKTITDNYGCTAHDIAKTRDYADIAEALKPAVGLNCRCIIS